MSSLHVTLRSQPQHTNSQSIIDGTSQSPDGSAKSVRVWTSLVHVDQETGRFAEIYTGPAALSHLQPDERKTSCHVLS